MDTVPAQAPTTPVPDAPLPDLSDLKLDATAAVKPKFVLKSESFVDQDGRQITQLTPVLGLAPRDTVRFIAHGQVHIRAKVPDPAGGPAQDKIQSFPINVPLPGLDTLEAALDGYDAAIEAAGRAQVEAMKTAHTRAQLGGGIIAPKLPGKPGKM